MFFQLTNFHVILETMRLILRKLNILMSKLEIFEKLKNLIIESI